MSTIAVVGDYMRQAGRYVHFDGYPNGVGCELVRLILRDGVDTVVTTIEAQPSGWMCLDSSFDETAWAKYDDGTAWMGGPEIAPVYGYGVVYVPEVETDSRWIPVHDTDSHYCPWTYMIAGDGDIFVYWNGRSMGVVNAFADDAELSMNAIERAFDGD